MGMVTGKPRYGNNGLSDDDYKKGISIMLFIILFVIFLFFYICSLFG